MTVEPNRPLSRASMADVARHARVSHGTVSNVLNHPERVRPETLAAVEASIAALGFVRHEAARQLRAGYSTTIGLLLLDAYNNPGFMDIAHGFEDAAGHQWTILMANSARDTKREGDYLRIFAERRFAGLMVIPNDQATEHIHHIRTDGIPMVVVERNEVGPDGLSVAVDDVAGGQMLAEHLISLGHRRITFVGDPDAALPISERFAGFRKGIARSGVAVELEIMAAALTIESGLEVGRELANRSSTRRPTAVAAAIDLLAFGILQSLLAHGIRVPRDISLAGYDDIPFTRHLSVPLTSVARPHYRMGTEAAHLLLSTITGSRPRRRHVRLRPELVVRQSTGAP